MKYILTFLLIFPLFSTFIYAQAPLGTQGSPTFEYFNVKVSYNSQSTWTKKVPVTIEFVATVDSDKVQIEWDAPSGVVVTPKYPAFFKVKAGQTYKFKALVEGKTAGTYNLAANVIAWQYNTNYTSSGSFLITFDEKSLTVPITQGYQINTGIKWFLIVGTILGLGYFGVIYAIKSKRKFDKWFNLPD